LALEDKLEVGLKMENRVELETFDLAPENTGVENIGVEPETFGLAPENMEVELETFDLAPGNTGVELGLRMNMGVVENKIELAGEKIGLRETLK